MFKCLLKQKTIDSLRTEIWDLQIQPQELIGLDLVCNIVENRTSALTSKKLLQAEIETGFRQVITKNEKVFCRKRSASLWFESVTKRWRGGWFSRVLPRKNSKTILENSRFSRRKTGQYITEKKNRNKTTNPSWIKPKSLYLFEVMIDFGISNSVVYQYYS